MIRKFLEKAAVAGPNKLGRTQALKGQARALKKIESGPGPNMTHPGHPAGLRAAGRTYIEEHGTGFGQFIRRTHPIYSEMYLMAPRAFNSTNLTMGDFRNYRRREFEVDRRLTSLL